MYRGLFGKVQNSLSKTKYLKIRNIAKKNSQKCTGVYSLFGKVQTNKKDNYQALQ